MKPRVLFILHLPPPTHGASMVGFYIKESRTIQDAVDGDFINLGTAKTLDDQAKNSLRKGLRMLGIMTQVFKSLIQHRYDLCYITLNAGGKGFYKDLLVVFIVKLFGKKIIYHFHNKGVSDPGQPNFNGHLYRFAFANSVSILLSEHLTYDIAGYVERENIFYCPNGIPDNDTDRIGNEGPCRLLFLSNMMAEKGVYDLLEACRMLRQKGERFECHFAGGWSDVSEYEFAEKVHEFGLNGTVIAHGKKFGSEKDQLYMESDVFIFPTYYHNECFPLVLLEATQHSLPVVTTSVGGITDIICDGVNGFIVPQRAPTALAEQIGFLIHNPSIRNEMGKEGRKRFEALFTIKKFEHTFSTILRTVAESK